MDSVRITASIGIGNSTSTNKIKNMIKTTIAGIILLASFTAFAEPQIQGTANELARFFKSEPKPNTVAIIGEAKILVPAHRAVLSLNIASENKSLAEAFRANTVLRGKLADYLKSQGLPEDRILVAKFSSTPQSGTFSSKVKSYRIENEVRISIQDDKELQCAVSVMDKWPEVQYAGLDFSYADKESLKKSVMAKACDNANEKKLIYEEKFGLKLVPVSFDGGDVAQRHSNSYNNNNGGGRGGMSAIDPTTGLPMASVALPVPIAPAAEESATSFGEMALTASVTVQYTVQAK